MKKKIIILILSVLFISIGIFFYIFYSNRYNLICTRNLVSEKQNFYVYFDFFGKLNEQTLESILYFDSADEAESYKKNLLDSDFIKKENIKTDGSNITLYEYGIGIIQDDVSNKKIKEVKKIYEDHGFNCKEVKK